MQKALNLVRADLKINPVISVKDAKFSHGIIDVFDLPVKNPESMNTVKFLPQPAKLHSFQSEKQ